MRRKVNKIIDEMKEQGVIEESQGFSCHISEEKGWNDKVSIIEG